MSRARNKNIVVAIRKIVFFKKENTFFFRSFIPYISVKHPTNQQEIDEFDQLALDSSSEL